MRRRFQHGTLYFDRRRNTWYFRWREAGKRRAVVVGTLNELRTKTSALLRVEELRQQGIIATNPARLALAPEQLITVNAIAQRYRSERMTTRFSTARSYGCWLNNHILPKWGSMPIAAVKPYDVDLWLKTLDLAPKSRVHIKGLLFALWECAMLWEYVPMGRNPMELVTIKDATKRQREPGVLTIEQFHCLLDALPEPFRTMVLVDQCLGLRFSA